MTRFLILLAFITLASASCVSPKEFKSSKANTSLEISQLKSKIRTLEYNIDESNRNQQKKIGEIQQQLDKLEDENKNLRNLVTQLRIEVVKMKQRLE